MFVYLRRLVILRNGKLSVIESQKITWEEIDVQIGRIAAYGGMERDARTIKLLNYLAKESFAGRGDRVRPYSIGLDVLDKDESFDPAKDSAVRVEIFKLRKLISGFYETEFSDDYVEIKFEKGNYKIDFTRVKLKGEWKNVYIGSIYGIFFITVFLLVYLYNFKNDRYCDSAHPIVVIDADPKNNVINYDKLLAIIERNPLVRVSRNMVGGEEDADLCNGVPRFKLTVNPTPEGGAIASLTDMDLKTAIWSEKFEVPKASVIDRRTLLLARIANEVGNVVPYSAVIAKWDDLESRREYRCLFDAQRYLDNLNERAFLEVRTCLKKYAFTSKSASVPAMFAEAELGDVQTDTTFRPIKNFDRTEADRALTRAEELDSLNLFYLKAKLKFLKFEPAVKPVERQLRDDAANEVISAIDRYYPYNADMQFAKSLFVIPYQDLIEAGMDAQQRVREITVSGYADWPDVYVGILNRDWASLAPLYEQISWLSDGDFLIVRLKLAKDLGKSDFEKKSIIYEINKLGIYSYSDLYNYILPENRTQKYKDAILEIGCELLENSKKCTLRTRPKSGEI